MKLLLLSLLYFLVLILLVAHNILRENQQDILNAMGSMYAAVLFVGITNATAVQPVVSIERFVSYRERAAGMYSALPFAFAQVWCTWSTLTFFSYKYFILLTFHFLLQVTIEFPYVLVQTLVYGTIFYCMGSYEWTLTKFLLYILFMYFTLLYFTFFGMMTIAITPSQTIAPIIAAPFYTLWNLFSGFMITRKVREIKHIVLTTISWFFFFCCWYFTFFHQLYFALINMLYPHIWMKKRFQIDSGMKLHMS